MKKELNILLTAFSFYTRINVSKWVKYDKEDEVKSMMYLPLVGVLVGTISGGVYVLASMMFSITLAIIFSMVTSVLVTGAFHEDGLADTCDGFGGGWSKDKILDIMKDSRVGTFGVVGLILILLLKFMAIYEFTQFDKTFNLHSYLYFNYRSQNTASMVYVFIIGHSLSRFIALTGMIGYSYARKENQNNKMTVLQQSSLSKGRFIVTAIFGLVPIVLFWNSYILFIIPVMFVVRWLMSRFFNKWIGGYTGDCLGAMQQVTEVVCYLLLYLVVT